MTSISAGATDALLGADTGAAFFGEVLEIDRSDGLGTGLSCRSNPLLPAEE